MTWRRKTYIRTPALGFRDFLLKWVCFHIVRKFKSETDFFKFELGDNELIGKHWSGMVAITRNPFESNTHWLAFAMYMIRKSRK